VKADFREEPAGLAVSGGNIYISGETDSAGMPITGNAFDDSISTQVSPPNSQYHDCFLIKMFPGTTGASVLQYATFFGGNTPATGAVAEYGNRGRNVVIAQTGLNRGLVIFSGVSTMTDMPTSATWALQPNWTPTDKRTGFVAVHYTD
jgi:hypothetical protein